MAQNDDHLEAVWQAYKLMKDNEDMLDSLIILCDVKR
jgi:hypothetical protein